MELRFLTLACDYDGTLAHDGLVAVETLTALEKMRASGRRLLLVTGRQLDDLSRVFPSVELFDRIVAENGGVVSDPRNGQVEALAPPPPDAFVAALKRRGVTPLSVGRTIVATWEPHHATVVDVIRETGLELDVILNKGAVMVLPSGINKASGLLHALRQLNLSPRNVVGVGDAENDEPFLSACGCAVAVANALDSVKARAHLVTGRGHGAGVVELIDRLLATDRCDVPSS
jgi:hydroxymethylpyrimidine pyrophosphatase-like HAD family hydrolase